MADEQAGAEPGSDAPGQAPEELDALRTEVAELRAELDGAQADSTWHRRFRQLMMGTLVVLTCVSLLGAIVGVWVRSTVYDTDNWVEMVGDLPKQPEVAEALATRMTTEMMSALDAQQRVAEVLPDQARILAGPIVNGLEGIVHDAMVTVISSDRFQDVWISVNRFAHAELVSLLRGDPGRIQAVDGTVYLNLLPLMARALGLVSNIAPDLIGNGQPVPEITPEMPTDEARAQLSAYLGRDLPADFGVIEVFQSDRLAAAQQGFALFARLVAVLVGLTVILAIVTVWLSRNRRSALLQLALGAVVTLAIARAIVRALADQVLEQISNPGNQGAIRTTVQAVTGTLQDLVSWVIGIGLLMAVAAFLSGPSRPARWIRRQVVGLTGMAGGASGRLMEQSGQANWLVDNLVGVRVGVLAAGVLAVILLPLTWFWFIVIVASVGFVELGLSTIEHTGVERAPGDAEVNAGGPDGASPDGPAPAPA